MSLRRTVARLEMEGLQAATTSIYRVAVQESLVSLRAIPRPRLTEATRAKRIAYMTHAVNNPDDYYAISFSDEKLFVCGVGSHRRVWVEGTDDPYRYIPHDGRTAAKVLVLGAVHPVAGGSTLVVINGTVSGPDYADLLAKVFIPWHDELRQRGVRAIWQDDNAPPHRTADCQARLHHSLCCV